MGESVISHMVSLDRRRNCHHRLCPASMGSEHPWKELERYAAHDERTSPDNKRALSHHQASNLYCLHSHSRLNPFHFSQLACRCVMDSYDCSRSYFTHPLRRRLDA